MSSKVSYVGVHILFGYEPGVACFTVVYFCLLIFIDIILILLVLGAIGIVI